MRKDSTPREETPAREIEQWLLLAAQQSLRLSDVPLSERLVLDQLLMDGLIERRIRPVESAVMLEPEGKLPAEWLNGDWYTETVLTLTEDGRQYLEELAGWQRQARIAARLAAAPPASPATQPAPAAPAPPADARPAAPAAGAAEENALSRLAVVYGPVIERLTELRVVLDSPATIAEKLERLSALAPIPPDKTAAEIAAMLGCNKAAVIRSAWWRRRIAERHNL